MNGAVKAANKNVKKIIQKMTITDKDWHKTLPFALHACRSPNFNRSHPIHFGIWNGGSGAFRNRNPLIKSIVRL